VYTEVGDAYSFQKSALSRITNIKTAPSNLHFDACFNYNGCSYIFYRTQTHPTGIRVVRNNEEHIFKFDIDIQSLSYDHLNSNLFLLTAQRRFLNLDLKELENFWTTPSYLAHLINTFKSVSLNFLFTHVRQLNTSATDFMVFDNTFFYIAYNKVINYTFCR
jgi:hypothetical protein